MSIKIKLTITNIAVFLLIIILIGLIFFSVMRASLEAEVEFEAKQACNEAVFALEKSVYADIYVLRSVAAREMFTTSNHAIEEKISVLQENISLFGYEYILLICDGVTYQITRHAYAIKQPDIEIGDYSNNENVLFGRFYDNENEGVLICERYTTDDNINGMIAAKRPAGWLWSGIASSLSLIDANIMISKQSGEVLYPTELVNSDTRFEIGDDAEEMAWATIESSEGEHGYYAISLLAEDISLYVTSYIEPEDINDQLDMYVFYFVVLALCGVLLIAVIVYIFSYLLTNSIVELSAYVENSQTVIGEMPAKFTKRKDETGKLSRSFALLMNRLVVSMDEKEYMAYHDSLTYLKNRYKMEQDITRIFAEKRSFAYALLDIDDFKMINDIYGHTVGDMLLVNLASIFKGLISEDLDVYRWGGDEFALIIYGETHDQYRAILENIMNEIEENFVMFDDRKVTISIGLCKYPTCADTYKDLLIAADKALAKAKTGGKNRYCFYNEI
ncbi:MAG: GGDEF domain-containing protein [Eubacteriales bacterium]|nr:GGDEF domain-containing protein [Eubacteriales bacterium]